MAEEILSRAIGLHDRVFGEHSVYSRKETWIAKLSEGDGFGGKIYLDSAGRGFLTMTRKNSRWNIWLTGVLPEFRREGVFRSLLNRFLDEHLGNRDELIVSVSTYPKKFPSMWNWIQRNGGVVEEECSDGKMICLIRFDGKDQSY